MEGGLLGSIVCLVPRILMYLHSLVIVVLVTLVDLHPLIMAHLQPVVVSLI
jgi:hypothetical protein